MNVSKKETEHQVMSPVSIRQSTTILTFSVQQLVL